MAKLKWTESMVILENGKKFTIWHTLAEHGNINTFEAAVANWKMRTKLSEQTQQSLINYINSKRLKGLAPDVFAA